MAALKDRLQGGLIGLLVGDALGVPYEFHLPQDLPPIEQIEFLPPVDFPRSHNGVPPGTWSDDGAQALALLASLNHCSKLDIDDFGQRLVDWYDSGYMAVDNRVFDVGIQTAHAIRNLMAGVPAPRAGANHEQANGNGSLMRVLPLALWHKGTDEELVRDAQLQSIVTHGHLRAQVCCALYCLWARRYLEESISPWPDAVATLRTIFDDASPERQELEWSIRPDEFVEGQGSGYVVDCLRSARWVLETGSYEEVVKTAVSLGRDTDTTACVAGGIAGIRDGVHAIPERWLAHLRGGELFKTEFEKLIRHRCVW